jgi:hypothetical protein
MKMDSAFAGMTGEAGMTLEADEKLYSHFHALTTLGIGLQLFYT